MEEEIFVSGFCKAQNQTRMVEIVFASDEGGKRTLEETDCAYGKCSHTKDCQLMRLALEEYGL